MATEQTAKQAHEKARKRERLALRVHAIVELCLEDGADACDVYAVLSGEAERIKQKLPN